MKLLGTSKIAILALTMVLLLFMLAGCADNNELLEIKKEWESVIQTENSDIAEIAISSHVIEPLYSSTFQSVSIMILEKEQIDLVISILSEQQMDWKNMPKTVDEHSEYQQTRYGKREIVVELFDKEKAYLMRICIFEDGICEVYWDSDIVSDTHVKWKKGSYAVVSKNVYESLDTLIGERVS